MATHSSILVWKIPWTEELGWLLSMGSQRVGHDWATSLSLFTWQSLEKEMATHSSVLAWRIPGTGEPGGLPSMGPRRVRHDWSDLAAGFGGEWIRLHTREPVVTERRCFDYFNVNILLVYCTTILQAIAIGFPAASGGKEPAVIWETWVQSLG